MIKYLIYILLFPLSIFSQTITLTPIGNQDVSGIPIEVEHEVTTVNGATSIRIFRTHYGSGSTLAYPKYPSTRSTMDKLFNSAYTATTLWWTGSLNATTSLNFTTYTTLTAAGASVPSGGEYYAIEVTFTMVPVETGLYRFGMASDDGCDLLIDGVSEIEFYGGKGMGSYKYGSRYLVAGQQYTVIARLQEYTGGDGMKLVWKRPSQNLYSLQVSEVGVPSTSWVSQGVKNTNTSGQASWTNSSNLPYRTTIDVSGKFHTITDADMNYMMMLKAGLVTLQSWDYYTCDCNNSATFSWDDIYFCYTLWVNGFYHNKYIFTQSEKNTIESDPYTNYYNTYFPTQVRVIDNENQFYIMGTGKHRAAIGETVQ